jgi:hypothetical protein
MNLKIALLRLHALRRPRDDDWTQRHLAMARAARRALLAPPPTAPMTHVALSAKSTRTPARKHRAAAVPGRLITIAALIAGLYLLLGWWYQSRFTDMAVAFDVWFRTDVNHYITWVREPGAWYRAPLHPLTLLVLKPYGLLLGALGLLPPLRAVVLHALPVIIAVAIAWRLPRTGSRAPPGIRVRKACSSMLLLHW